VGYGGGLNEKVEVEVKEVDVFRGESGGVQVRDRLIPHRFKGKSIFPSLFEKVLVDSLHLVTWRFKIKQPSYYEHFPPFPSFLFVLRLRLLKRGGGIQGLCF